MGTFRNNPIVLSALCAFLFALNWTPFALAQERVALVIGNSTYRNVPSLANPANDAKLMADTLRSLGFKLVGGGAQLDLDKPGFDRAVQNFGRELQGAAVALFYYAGHGVQVRGGNYLVPVNANPTREAEIDFQMLDANLVLRQMEGSGTRLNLVILDACRNNPFGGRGLRSTTGGLAQMQAPEGTLISFATQPGNVAVDGSDGHSPFTKALADTIRKPGLGLFEAFNDVGLAVKQATGGAQQPWVSSSPIGGKFYFTAPEKSTVSNATEVPLSDPGAQAWAVVQNTTSLAVLEIFIQQYASSFYGEVARARLAELKRSQVAVVTPPPAGNPSASAKSGWFGGTMDGFFGSRRSEPNGPAIEPKKEIAAVAPQAAKSEADARIESQSRNDLVTLALRPTKISGIGVQLTEEKNKLWVVSVHENSPAEKQGVLANDIVVKIDGQATSKMTLSDAVGRIKGPVGSKVILTIKREGGVNPFEVVMTREEIHLTDGQPDQLGVGVLPMPGLAGPLQTAKERALKPKDVFKECDHCPEMVVVPAGSFVMGSPESEEARASSEGPQHTVTFAKAFAVGRFAVTFDEWDACVADGGCNGYRPSDEGWGRSRQPVINVSWDDAQTYVAWLSRKTGKSYRLLSEAEREYVTRAGTTTRFWWGATISPSQANYKGRYMLRSEQKVESRRPQTVRVDSFRPDPWGLYQVHGNVWEWVEDCDVEFDQSTPGDGSARTRPRFGNCQYRVLRGGSADDKSSSLRSAGRSVAGPHTRDTFFGFRVARTLEKSTKQFFGGVSSNGAP